MITYLVTQAHAYTMKVWLDGYGKHLAARIRILTYEQLFAERRLPLSGCVIFSDLDRLTAEAKTALAGLHDRLREAAPGTTLLNHPLDSLLRYDLLRELHACGINSFNAYRMRDRMIPQRFPAFLRRESGFEHEPMPLVTDRAQAEAGFLHMQMKHGSLEDGLFVEYCETADGMGLYRKFGAFVVGDCIVPRHVFFSRKWMVKIPDLEWPELLAEELAYIETNPHAAPLLDICRRARIQYGRIDYAFMGDRLQIWEINTNPMVVNDTGSGDPRAAVHRRFTELVSTAFDGVDRDA